MYHQLTIVEKPSCLHAIVTGLNTMENVMGGASRPGTCTRSLRKAARTRGLFKTVAYVDVNAGGELMRFAETVANIRGLSMIVFANVAEAEIWLAGKPR